MGSKLRERIIKELLVENTNIFAIHPTSYYRIIDAWQYLVLPTEKEVIPTYVYSQSLEDKSVIPKILIMYCSFNLPLLTVHEINYSKLAKDYDIDKLNLALPPSEIVNSYPALEQAVIRSFKDIYEKKYIDWTQDESSE